MKNPLEAGERTIFAEVSSRQQKQHKNEMKQSGLVTKMPTSEVQTSAHDYQATAVSSKTYRPEIDSLRAVAVIAVLLSHWVPGFIYLVNWGLAGVYLFFVISGYVITRGLLNEKTASGGHIDIRKFFARRVVRIWPIYFLTIAFIYFVWPGFVHGGVAWHMLFLSNALFSIEGKFMFPIHFWSLSVEQQFYLAWPFLILLCGRRQLVWSCMAMIAVSPVSRWYFAAELQNMPASFYSLMSNLDCLAAGALVAIAERYRSSTIDTTLNIAGAAGGLLLGCILAMSYQGNGLWDTAFTGTAIAAISAWLIAWLGRSQIRGRPLCNPFTLYIGKISYGIYLYHLLVGSYLSTTALGKQPPWIYALACGAATIAIATASWYLIERPLLALKPRANS